MSFKLQIINTWHIAARHQRGIATLNISGLLQHKYSINSQ